MTEYAMPIREPIWERLESLTAERRRPTRQLIEEALIRYLDQEEHLDAMFRIYGVGEGPIPSGLLAAE